MTVAEMLARWLGLDEWLPRVQRGLVALARILRALLFPQPLWVQLELAI